MNENKRSSVSDKIRKILIVTAIILVLLVTVIGLSLYFAVKGEPSLCTTTECVKASNILSNFIDETVDPCTDFYHFTCNTYLNNMKRGRFKSVNDDIGYKIDEHIQNLIEQPPHYSDSYFLKSVKQFFVSCMNETAVEKANLNTIRRLLRQAGGWPVLESGSWPERDFDWKKTIQKLRAYGAEFNIFLFIDFETSQEIKNQHKIKVRVISVQEYAEPKQTREFMIEIAEMFGASRNLAERDFDNVMSFHRRLTQIMNSTTETMEGLIPKTVGEIQQKYPSVQWKQLFTGVFAPTEIYIDDHVYIEDPILLEKLLKEINNTPKRIVANYMMLNVIQRYIDLLPRRFRERYEKYIVRTSGFPSEPRHTVCFNYVKESTDLLLLVPFYQKYYTHDVKHEIRNILNGIKKEYLETLNHIEWIDENSKKLIKTKIAGSTDYITYEECLSSRDNIDNLYGENKIYINTSDPLDIFFTLNDVKYHYLFGSPKSEAEKHGYDLFQNTIVLNPFETYGIYFKKGRPNYLNYGGMGSSIANQLSTAFINGRNYDDSGNLQQWSTSESLLNYNNMLQCIADDFKSYYIPEIEETLNSSQTKVKDAALLLSKYIAYNTYNSWINEFGEELSLPGIPYTPKQLFWIASSVYECSLDSPGSIKFDIKRGMSPARIRVNGPLKHLPQFSRDFNCQSGSKMHVENKCDVF